MPSEATIRFIKANGDFMLEVSGDAFEPILDTGYAVGTIIIKRRMNTATDPVPTSAIHSAPVKRAWGTLPVFKFEKMGIGEMKTIRLEGKVTLKAVRSLIARKVAATKFKFATRVTSDGLVVIRIK